MGKKQLIIFLLEQRQIRSLYFFALILFAIACQNPKPEVFISPQKNEIKIEVDSVQRWSELAYFPIRIRLTNNTNKKVVLVFDSISNDYKDQVKNLIITTEEDTFNLGIRLDGEPFVFKERTITSFVCLGYLRYGKRHFESSHEIEAIFKKGKLEYHLDEKLRQKVSFEGVQTKGDTLLLPVKLVARTDNALVVDTFLPQSLWTREIPIKE